MTQEKVEQILELARDLKEKIIVVTNGQTKVFIDFNNEEYKDTHVNVHYLFSWNIALNKWNILSLEDIDFIEFH